MAVISKPDNHSAAGFTLVEVLVALFIFAIIASASTVALSSTLQSKEAIKERSEILTSLQLARATLKLDLLQSVIRPTRDAFGTYDNIGFSGIQNFPEEPFLKFVKRGWLNPTGLSARSNLQAVEYYLVGSNFVRRTLLRTDPTEQTPSNERILLTGIIGVNVEFLVDGTWQNQWFGDAFDDTRLPTAIALTLNSEEFGIIRQLFIVGGAKP
jgi:general secretion pathway protein J